jgi:hypothetical protein
VWLTLKAKSSVVVVNTVST